MTNCMLLCLQAQVLLFEPSKLASAVIRSDTGRCSCNNVTKVKQQQLRAADAAKIYVATVAYVSGGKLHFREQLASTSKLLDAYGLGQFQ